ncbi:MAG: sortase domain-bontaining protein [Aristaeellaceae bacterium]
MKASGKPRGDSTRERPTHGNRQRHSGNARYIISFICVALMIVCAAYVISWEIHRVRIERANASYQALYAQGDAPETVAPTDVPTATPTDTPTQAPTDAPTQAPTAVPTNAPTDVPTDAPDVVDPSAEAVAVDATLVPRTTADADTLVFALQTPPPVQESFAELLALNPETVGYLRAGESISLPVVQRRNDNEYYLNHSFEGEESLAGTLFLDGSNLLVPEDDNLIIYGHNMRNGTMFHALSLYESADYLRKHPIVNFDTLYENRLYVPFAAFTATMDEGSERYLDIRQFLFDETSFELFVLKMEKLSTVETKVDVRYGDRLLLLVTCEYLYDNGRFVVALRELRPDETEAQMRSLLQSARDR